MLVINDAKTVELKWNMFHWNHGLTLKGFDGQWI